MYQPLGAASFPVDALRVGTEVKSCAGKDDSTSDNDNDHRGNYRI